MSSSKIVIIGAGAAGLSTARALAELGCTDVTVVEKDHLAAASSSLSLGIYCRLYFEPRDIELRVATYRELCRLEQTVGLPIRRNGFVRPAHDEAAATLFREAVETQRRSGVEDATFLELDDLRRLMPDLRCDDITGAMYSPTEGYTDGQQLCIAYAEEAERMGVTIMQRCEVLGVELGSGTRHRVTTSRGEIECDVIVNAAGAWAGRIGEMLGAPVPMAPERHQVCIFELREPLPYELPTFMDYMPYSGVEGLYFRPEGEKQLMAGLHTNEVLDRDAADPDGYYAGVDAAYSDIVVERLLDRVPQLDHMGMRGGWAGIYPNSRDSELIIGKMPQGEGLYAVCGLNGGGVYLSAIAGRVAAEEIALGEVRCYSEPQRFDPGRFADTAVR